MDFLLATLASLLAGFIDALVGGGGLILLPALFALFPEAAAATLLGSSKGAAFFGTATAARQYHKILPLPWKALLPAVFASMLGAFSGAWVVTLISPDFLRRLLPFLMLAVLIYTLLRGQMGQTHVPRYQGRQEQFIACIIGLTIGFYDGFFGPGTGSFFVFLFVRALGYDFLHATVCAKLLNLSTNFAALCLFGITGHIWWALVLPMALANITGALLGSTMALRYGSGFVRWIFIAVVSLLIVKTGADAFF
ncbi:hypothetical protein AXE65_03690 [Ventosimonas gracilis]|uniref:Probable membrane transporter protein n=1 Tax=Ventosimonas gracilis TaxID=1680762 RepID=A0A139SRY1_9GAMM|nr:TSUP family transporter [Ventosimonas gracilis]KXU37307.1 hypothetical protein AXE65_03690 [Ventosimonas gracilis]